MCACQGHGNQRRERHRSPGGTRRHHVSLGGVLGGKALWHPGGATQAPWRGSLGRARGTAPAARLACVHVRVVRVIPANHSGRGGGPPQGGRPGTGRGPPSLGRLTPLSRRRWGDGVWGEDSTETCWTLRRCCPSQIIPERRLFQTLPTTRRFSAADSQNPDTVDGLAVADPRLRGSAHLRAQGDQRPGDPARPGLQGPVRALRSGDTEATGRAPVSRPGGRRHREGLGRAAGPSATRRPSRPTGLPEPRPPAPERKAVLSDGDAGPWEPEAAQAEGGGRDDPRCPQ